MKTARRRAPASRRVGEKGIRDTVKAGGGCGSEKGYEREE